MASLQAVIRIYDIIIDDALFLGEEQKLNKVLGGVEEASRRLS